MTIHQLINLGIKKLNKTSPSAALDSEVLLSYVLKKPKEYLVVHMGNYVSPKQEKRFLTFINRRLLGWPVAYLTKSKEFYKLNLYVDKHVLIPRPETEGLVELVLNYLKVGSDQIGKINILDIGTGSGNIIISLAKKLGTKHNYFASDISPKAIAVAKKNAKRQKVKIKFVDGNLLEPWGKQHFDLIVANLPYLAKLVDPSTKFEPRGALVAAKKGLKLYEELFKQIYNLQPKSYNLFLEIGHDQAPAIKKLAKKFWPVSKTKIYKDLFGRQRYAVITLL